MSEQVKVFSKNRSFLKIVDKSDHHKKMMQEFFKKGKVSTHHRHSKILFLTSQGKLILQKRSKWKGDNPGVWDKTVGGHLFRNETFDFCAVRESAEELQIPSTVILKKDLSQALKLVDLDVMGLMFLLKLDKKDISERKLPSGKTWKEPSPTAFYLGYYDGPIRFETKEASGFRISTLSEIKKEIKENPKAFTIDLIKIIKRWEKFIKPLKLK